MTLVLGGRSTPIAGANALDGWGLSRARMERNWEPLRALHGGTFGMRDAETTYLPKESEESDAMYDLRRNRSFLFPAYPDTIRHLASKPFQREVHLKEGSPAVHEVWSADLDLEGTSLTEFAFRGFECGLDRGLVHALTDVPRLQGSDRFTRQQESEAGFRPYATLVSPDNVLAARKTRHAGVDVLTHLRIRETRLAPMGAYGEVEIPRIRVYNRRLSNPRARSAVGRRGETTFEVFERPDQNGEWVRVDRGIISVNRIPFHTLYFDRTGEMQGKPPLMELAQLNIQHWQKSSDLSNLSHTTSLPMLWGAGWSAEDVTDEAGQMRLVLGPGRVWLARDPEAKLGFIEHSGSALGLLRLMVQDLELRMADMAMQPLLETVPRRSATEAAIVASNQAPDMIYWVRNLENWLASILDDMSLWMNQEPGAIVDVFSEFAALSRQAEELREARRRKDISLRTYWEELIRRGILTESFDPQEEANRMGMSLEDLDKAAPAVDPAVDPAAVPPPQSPPPPQPGAE